MNSGVRFFVLAALGVVTYYWSVHPQSAPIRTDLSFPAISGVLGGLFVLVLLIERATEIAIAIWREKDTGVLKATLERLQADAGRATEAAAKQDELVKYQAETKGIALLVGFSMAVVACAGGVGILETILNTAEANPSFIRFIDIVLTSGLLAGGSDAFHQFVRALEKFFNKS